MNGIICFGRKRGGCVPINIPDLGPPDAPDALAKREEAAQMSLDLPKSPAPNGPPPRVARSPNLVEIPAGTERVRCTGATCKAMVYPITHPKTGNPTRAAVEETIKLKDGVIVPTGAFAPYLDAGPGRETIKRPGLGYSHFIDCPDAPSFKRK
jgi:hypothetical protein